jgi:hypothetical protein
MTISNKTLSISHDTTLIDRPTDHIASPVETLLPLFGTHRWLAPSIRLSLDCCSFVVCFSFIYLSFIYHKRHPTSGSSADRHIWLFGPYESRHTSVNGFPRGCLLFSSKYAHARVGFSDHRSFWYMPLSIIGSFPFILYIYEILIAITIVLFSFRMLN